MGEALQRELDRLSRTEYEMRLEISSQYEDELQRLNAANGMFFFFVSLLIWLSGSLFSCRRTAGLALPPGYVPVSIRVEIPCVRPVPVGNRNAEARGECVFFFFDGDGGCSLEAVTVPRGMAAGRVRMRESLEGKLITESKACGW